MTLGFEGGRGGEMFWWHITKFFNQLVNAKSLGWKGEPLGANKEREEPLEGGSNF